MELSKEYVLLFNAITDTIHDLEKATENLKRMQAEAEELCVKKNEVVEFERGAVAGA